MLIMYVTVWIIAIVSSLFMVVGTVNKKESLRNIALVLSGLAFSLAIIAAVIEALS